MTFWIFGILLILAGIATAFFVIARKGRRLRTAHRLPGEASSAVLEDSKGKQYPVSRVSQFYLGNHPQSDVVLANDTREYAVCIFYHRKRFAFQTLSSSRGILVNQDEMMAGYLSNGDVLVIAGESFVFRCD
jgi:hypothetical protein